MEKKRSKAMKIMIKRKEIMRKLEHFDSMEDPAPADKITDLSNEAEKLLKEAREAGGLDHNEIMELALVH